MFPHCGLDVSLYQILFIIPMTPIDWFPHFSDDWRAKEIIIWPKSSASSQMCSVWSSGEYRNNSAVFYTHCTTKLSVKYLMLVLAHLTCDSIAGCYMAADYLNNKDIGFSFQIIRKIHPCKSNPSGDAWQKQPICELCQ